MLNRAATVLPAWDAKFMNVRLAKRRLLLNRLKKTNNSAKFYFQRKFFSVGSRDAPFPFFLPDKNE